MTINNDISARKVEEKQPFKDCSAFCPKCKSDLYYTGKECICKNKECSWTCSDCKDN